MTETFSKDQALDFVRNVLGSGFWTEQTSVLQELSDISFIGFDPIAIIIAFMGKTPVTNHKKDLARLIQLYYERGTNIDVLKSESKARMSQDGVLRVQHLVRAYDIKGKGAAKAPGVITLSRLSLAFPMQACMYCNTHRVNFPIELPAGVPKVICTQAIAALIPASVYSSVIVAVAWASVLISRVIDKRETTKEKSDKELFNEALNYVEIGMRSKVIPEKNRVQCLKTLKVLTSQGTVEPNITAFAKSCGFTIK
ncbi:Uncharacterised protein r2_g184 [Pycnogonum litorale]